MFRVLHRRAFGQQSSRSFAREDLSTLLVGRPPTIGYEFCQRKQFGGIPGVLLPPVIFVGLGISLWTWKCFMMVIFQNKIIYMPGLPPNARWETLEAYKNQCVGIQWREERIKAQDGTQISLCVASVSNRAISTKPSKTIYIVYFQGNASSIPPRLPFLSPALRRLRDRAIADQQTITYILVCCSYRGYWTSRGRPSEKGIELDAAATLKWIKEQENGIDNEEGCDKKIPVVLWGQSIGAGVATSLAARQDLFLGYGLSLKALILETPFLSIRAMLETLYPQKWLPYRHLWPFLRNHLDSWKSLGLMTERYLLAGVKSPKVWILEAERDELVPKEHGDKLEKRCLELGLDVNKKVIGTALHTDVMVRSGGVNAVVEALEGAAEDEINNGKSP